MAQKIDLFREKEPISTYSAERKRKFTRFSSNITIGIGNDRWGVLTSNSSRTILSSYYRLLNDFAGESTSALIQRIVLQHRDSLSTSAYFYAILMPIKKKTLPIHTQCVFAERESRQRIARARPTADAARHWREIARRAPPRSLFKIPRRYIRKISIAN